MVEYETGNWFRILFRINGSVLPRIFFRVLVVTLLSCAVTYVKFGLGYELPNSMRLHTVIGVALGLLLVFRTNASYERFWEGRIQVGDMVTQTTGRQERNLPVILHMPAHSTEINWSCICRA